MVYNVSDSPLYKLLIVVTMSQLCFTANVLLSYRTKHNLKVREHKTLGPYVEGLSTLAVRSFRVIICN